MRPKEMQNRNLTISVPRERRNSLEWVVEFVLGASNFQLRCLDADEERIVIERDGIRLVLLSVFPGRDLLCPWPASQPMLDTVQWIDTDVFGLDALGEHPRTPVLFGNPVFRRTDQGIETEIDLFGGMFFLLSRAEEICSDIKDVHHRFPGKSSLAARNGFLDRPIADEYREIVLGLIHQLWPDVDIPRVSGAVHLSCDVDEPFDRCRTSPTALMRTAAGDLVKRLHPGLAARRVLNAVCQKVSTRFDPCYTFDWYLDVCEANGLQATFYFIAENGAGVIDGDYAIEDRKIAELFRKISERGHTIGMHGSYMTFRDPERLGRERRRLNAALADAGVLCDVVKNRQHYLRWDASCTPDYLEAAGFKSDSTGGYADLPGFRFGTARPFRMWSWQAMKPLHLIQEPLIVMENSLLSPVYMGLDHEAAASVALVLKRRALAFGGNFGLLWHNSELLSRADRKAVQAIIGR